MLGILGPSWSPSRAAPFAAGVVLLGVGGLANAAEVGAPINEAVAIHLTNGGLDTIGRAVSKVLPPTIPILASGGELQCSGSDEVPLDWSLDALDLLVTIDEAAMVTADGRLDLDVYMTLGSTASTLTVVGDCTVLTDLDEDCGVELPTTALRASFGMQLTETEGVFDVVVDSTELYVSPVGNPLSDCTFASAIGTVLGQDPELISNLLLTFVEPELEGLGPTIETALEDGLNSLNIETSVDLLGTSLDVALYPTLLELEGQGLVLGLGAEVVPGAVSECVDSSAGSTLFETGWPEFSETAGDSAFPVDASILVGADFLDHTLYTVWAAGLLCIDAGALLQDALGVPLTTGFVSGLLGEPFQKLFPESKPAALQITSAAPPFSRFSDDGVPIEIVIEDMALDFYSEVDFRQTRVFRASASADIGLDIALDGATLTPELVFADPPFAVREEYSELLPPGYATGLGGLLGTVVGTMLPDELLPTIELPLPLGIGIDALLFVPTDAQDWQGGHVLIDTSSVEPLDIAGCSLDGFGCDGGSAGVELDFESILGCSADGGGGCGDAGCGDSTCATGPRSTHARAARGRLGMLGLMVFGLVARRRRRKGALRD